jgi:hypothetical protein
MRVGAALLIAAMFVSWAGTSRADDIAVRPLIGETDGAYGRFGGDTAFSLGAGPELTADAARIDMRFEAIYFSTAGVYVHWSQALRAASDRSVAGVGVILRPAFLPRFGLNLEQGPAFLDLFLDSIALSLGAYAGNRPVRSLSERGFEASLAAALPLQPSAEGIWLEARGSARWPDASQRPQRFSGALLVCYRWLWITPLVN